MLKLIAFDFDGTLADSVEFCISSFEYVFEKYLGEKAPDRETIYQHFGMNEIGIIRTFLGEINPAAEEDFFRFHRELHPVKCPEPYPGILPLLAFLKEKGVELTVLTGRAETSCKISMEFLNMGHYFSRFQYGSPDKNDKCGHILKLLKDTGLQKDEIFYVGDALSDVAACKAAGVTCLAAAWASSARVEELEKNNPGLVFRSVAAMKEYIASELS